MFLQGPHWQLGLDLPFSCTLGGTSPIDTDKTPLQACDK